jgi:hypothetical protein
LQVHLEALIYFSSLFLVQIAQGIFHLHHLNLI